MNKEWSEKNREMQSLIGKEASFREGINVLVNLRNDLFSQISSIVNTYPAEAFYQMPFSGAEGYLRYAGARIRLIDTPGTYSVKPRSSASAKTSGPETRVYQVWPSVPTVQRALELTRSEASPPSGLISSDAEAKLIVGAGAGAGAGIFPPQAAVRMTADIKDSILCIILYFIYSWRTMSDTATLVPAGTRPKSKIRNVASASAAGCTSTFLTVAVPFFIARPLS